MIQKMQNNKLIAEFMGYTSKEYRDGTYEFYIPEHKRYEPEDIHDDECYNYFPGEMGYHSSWDWLMPVAKKCYMTTKDIKTEEWLEWLQNCIISFSINPLYKAVVEFIEWYNKQGEK